jgi:hypothetical protein
MMPLLPDLLYLEMLNVDLLFGPFVAAFVDDNTAE